MTAMTMLPLDVVGRRKSYQFTIGADGDTYYDITHGFPTATAAIAQAKVVPIITPNNAKGALSTPIVTFPSATAARVDRGVTASTATGVFTVTLWYVHSLVE